MTIEGNAAGDVATAFLAVLLVGAITYLVVGFGMEFIRRRKPPS